MANLLVIDDEPDIRALFAAELEDEGHGVQTAADFDEAWDRLQTQTPDLVVLDIQVGRENGLLFLQKISRSYPRLPVILCTAYSCYKDDFSSWIADAYVVKSSDLGGLKKEIARQLRRQEEMRAQDQEGGIA